MNVEVGKTYWFTERTRRGGRRFEVRISSVLVSPRYQGALYVSWGAVDPARDSCGSFGASTLFDSPRPFGVVAVEPGTTPARANHFWSPRPGDSAYDLMC